MPVPPDPGRFFTRTMKPRSALAQCVLLRCGAPYFSTARSKSASTSNSAGSRHEVVGISCGIAQQLPHNIAFDRLNMTEDQQTTGSSAST
jgi:hypothetical protein